MTESGRDVRPPSVDRLVRSLNGIDLPHPLLVKAARAAIAADDPASASARAEVLARSVLRPIVNATGVLLHTNLGRAPLGTLPKGSTCNLEFDLESGRRGRRAGHVADLIAITTGAESALVVNNGAAALLLALAVLASGRPVIVSRGELVEIGGGFRLPEVLAASGARLVEVGTTNRTRMADYQSAVAENPDAALVLKVHKSNFRITGFTQEVDVRTLAQLDMPLVVDIGSGLLDADTPWLCGAPPHWLANEPAGRQTLEAGAALITFSGDKLLGGPQAGVIAGRGELVKACAQHPLARVLRPGGLVLAALQHTMTSYVQHDGAEIPFWRMATMPLDSLRQRAEAIAAAVGPHVNVVGCTSVTGGGSLPDAGIASAGVAVLGDHAATLRRAKCPVIARVEHDRTICDLRSVSPDDDGAVVDALRQIAASTE